MYDNKKNIITKIRSHFNVRDSGQARMTATRRGTSSPIANQNGQILLFTILVSLVALTVAIAATRRTTVDIRRVDTTTTADRAFSAAEAGIEEKLLEIKEGISVPPSCGGQDNTDCGLDFGTSSVSQIGVSSENALTLSALQADASVSVHFVEDIQNPANPFQGQLQVTWDEGSALVLTLVLQDNATDPPSYNTDRQAWRCGTISGNLFPSAGTIVSGKCSRSVTVSSANGMPIMMRVRAMHSDTSLSVAPTIVSSTNPFPIQLVSITSTGQAGDAQRTVQARRTHAGLPSVFDFALFNASTTTRVAAQQLPVGTPGVRWFEVIAGQVHSNYNGSGNDFEMYTPTQIPSTQFFCEGPVGCIISTRDTIGIPTARAHAEAQKRNWRASNYLNIVDMNRYSYDNLLHRMRNNIDAEGNGFAAVESVLQSGGVVLIRTAQWITEVTLNETEWNRFGPHPVVVFIERATGDANLIVDADNPPFHFAGKNVMFIVSGGVEVRSSVYTFDAAVIADGKIMISNNL